MTPSVDKPNRLRGFIQFADEQPEEVIEWYHWWRVFTVAGFRHVRVVFEETLPVNGGGTVKLYTMLDPQDKRLMVKTLFSAYEMNSYYHSYTLKFDIEMDDNPNWSGIGTCMTCVKRALGLGYWSVLTPKGLYYLMIDRFGAIEVTDEQVLEEDNDEFN